MLKHPPGLRPQPQVPRHLDEPVPKQQDEQREAPRVARRRGDGLKLGPVERDARGGQVDEEGHGEEEVGRVVDGVVQQGGAQLATEREVARLGAKRSFEADSKENGT